MQAMTGLARGLANLAHPSVAAARAEFLIDAGSGSLTFRTCL